MAAPKRNSLVRWTLTAALGIVSPALAQSSIGFVSLDRILREAPAAQRAQKKLEEEFSQRGQELSKMADQLKKLQGNMEKNAVTMSDSERQKREREFGDINRDFQRRQREFNEDLAQRRKEEFDGVLERTNRAVRKIAEAEKLDIVFQNEQVVWASTRIDITDKVIKALEDPRAGK
ncbi:MAG TPA: OmpH family outer membrane protein [Burkholderiales bacterium]|nr:OmpH family outer membrane protein [Burkholderiales bacterium]